MARKLMGRKRGMTTIFDDTGHATAATVISVEPNVVTQIKTREADGYTAVQIAFEEVTAKDPRKKEARTSKPLRGHFARANTAPRKHLMEFRVENTEGYELGQQLGIETFSDEPHVDVQGVSIGKGYQGVMKLHGFHGGPAAHGSGFHRHAGSTGMRSTPGRCFQGSPRASQMGNQRVTNQNNKVLFIDETENIIVVKGSIPGPRNGLVVLSPAVKKQA